jgi:sarcosine oxidase subunit beta
MGERERMSPNGNAWVADFVIVGAGVMGASIAYHLTKRKAGRIVVLEKDHVGRGASGRPSALIRMHHRPPPEVRLAITSLEMFQNWAGITGESGDFRRTGFVQLVPAAEINLLKANVEMQRQNGMNVQLITADELKKIEPDWYVGDVVAAAYEPDSGYGDGASVANDFLAKARELGVEYRPRTRASQFLIKGDRIRGVATDQGEIQAPVVIAATGQWNKRLFARVNVDLPIQTECHEVCILKNPEGMKGGGCASMIPSSASISARKDSTRLSSARSRESVALIPKIFREGIRGVAGCHCRRSL